MSYEFEFELRLTLLNGEGDCVSASDGVVDAVVEGEEDGAGMDDDAGDEGFADEDLAMVEGVGAVADFEVGRVSSWGMGRFVEGDEDGDFAMFGFEVFEFDSVGACGDEVVDVFGAVADVFAVDVEAGVAGVGGGVVADDGEVHNFRLVVRG